MAYTITDVGALNVLTVLRGINKDADTVQRQVSSMHACGDGRG